MSLFNKLSSLFKGPQDKKPDQENSLALGGTENDQDPGLALPGSPQEPLAAPDRLLADLSNRVAEVLEACQSIGKHNEAYGAALVGQSRKDRQTRAAIDLICENQNKILSYFQQDLSEDAAQGAVMDFGESFLLFVNEFADPHQIKILMNKFGAMLAHFDLSSTASPGDAFDPALHQAVHTESNDYFPDNSVVEVVKPGFTSSIGVLRFATVVVNRHIAAPPEFPKAGRANIFPGLDKEFPPRAAAGKYVGEPAPAADSGTSGVFFFDGHGDKQPARDEDGGEAPGGDQAHDDGTGGGETDLEENDGPDGPEDAGRDENKD